MSSPGYKLPCSLVITHTRVRRRSQTRRLAGDSVSVFLNPICCFVDQSTYAVGAFATRSGGLETQSGGNEDEIGSRNEGRRLSSS